jgi:hypothetical protein
MARLYSVSKQSCAVKIFLSPNFPLIVVWTSWSWWQCWSLCSCASEVSPWSGILFVSLFLLLFGISLTCLKKKNLHQIMTLFLLLFCALLLGLTESSSDLMWVATHTRCYWKRQCILLGKRHEWTTWDWGYHWLVITYESE